MASRYQSRDAVVLMNLQALPQESTMNNTEPDHERFKKGEENFVNDWLRANKSTINEPIHDGKTALHYAAKGGKSSVVKTLLSEGADIRKQSVEEPDTPLHVAADAGHAEVLDVMIDSAAKDARWECMTLKGYRKETPFHLACRSGCLQTIQSLPKEMDINELTTEGEETPLHFAAQAKRNSLKIVKILVEEFDAKVDPSGPPSMSLKTPFHKAVLYDHPEVAMYLLEKGAKVDVTIFSAILNEGYERLAKAVIESDQFPLVLRGTYKRHRKRTTAFRELIMKMPDVARLVLDKCALEDPGKAEQSAEYRVLYNYEYLEDFEDSSSWCRSTSEAGCVDDGTSCGFNDILKECPTKWIKDRQDGRLENFSRKNHPLQIMVDYDRLDLLTHPVAGSLIHYKWMKFGLVTYLLNLLTYAVYLALLTTFALTVPNPQSPQCKVVTTDKAENCTLLVGTPHAQTIALSVLVLLMTLFRIFIELIQFGKQRLSYLKDWVNWVESVQYICTLIFVVIYFNEQFCVLYWQWQVGVAAVFLGWMVLILFMSKIPWLGIYVLILIKIFWTFMQMVILTLLLIISFGVTFYMIFFDCEALRSPFSDVPRSLLKTMTMTTGELDYGDLFRLDPSGGNDELAEIKYPPISYILWIVFLVLMPIILTNMLTSLAVGDTNEVRNEALQRKLALQVEQVLSMQGLLMAFQSNRVCLLLWRCTVGCCCSKDWAWRYSKQYRIIYPDGHKEMSVSDSQRCGKMLNYFLKKLQWKKLKFNLWEGDHYNNRQIINSVLYPKKSDLEEKVDKIEKTLETSLAEIQENQKMMRALLTRLEGIELAAQPATRQASSPTTRQASSPTISSAGNSHSSV